MFTSKEQRQIKLALDIIKSNIPSKISEGSWIDKSYAVLISKSNNETWYGRTYGKEFYVSCHKALFDGLTLAYDSRLSTVSVYKKSGSKIKWIADETDCDFLAECVK